MNFNFGIKNAANRPTDTFGIELIPLIILPQVLISFLVAQPVPLLQRLLLKSVQLPQLLTVLLRLAVQLYRRVFHY